MRAVNRHEFGDRFARFGNNRFFAFNGFLDQARQVGLGLVNIENLGCHGAFLLWTKLSLVYRKNAVNSAETDQAIKHAVPRPQNECQCSEGREVGLYRRKRGGRPQMGRRTSKKPGGGRPEGESIAAPPTARSETVTQPPLPRPAIDAMRHAA